jgi:release factor glutamine methyltransferase
MWTLKSLLKKATEFLDEKNVDSPRLEAEILLAHTLSMDRVGLYANHERPLSKEEVDRYRELIMQRARGNPSAYLVGKKEFFSLSFKVSPAVLIPRPETEDVVQLALDLIPGDGDGLWVADLCTGSGCIPVTLLKLRSKLRACALDISAEALAKAGENAGIHEVSDRLELHEGDLFAPLKARSRDAPFHLITCNPPYIDPEGSWPAAPEVAGFEPPEALYTPAGDPAFYYRKVMDEAKSFIAPQGTLIFELGMDLLRTVEESAQEKGWTLKEVRKDLAGIERVAAFRPA